MTGLRPLDAARDSIEIDVSGGDVTGKFRALRCDGAGDVVVDTEGGTQRTLKFAAGETRVIYVTKIYQSGTTATDIEGLV